MASAVHRVAVVAFPGISPFHLAAPYAVLQGTARRPLPLPYRLTTCAEEPGVVPTSAGWPVVVEHGLETLDAADTIVLPSWDTTKEPSPTLVEAVTRAHRRGARVVGLCLGSFVVARSGIADGREVATHWAAAAELAAAAPRVRVRSDVLWCDEGDVVTSAGVAAGLDCLIHLVRTDLGASAAAAVARSLVLAPHRDGSQAQFIPAPLRPAPGSDLFDDALIWALEHLAERVPLDAWAARAAMSRRRSPAGSASVRGPALGPGCSTSGSCAPVSSSRPPICRWTASRRRWASPPARRCERTSPSASARRRAATGAPSPPEAGARSSRRPRPHSISTRAFSPPSYRSPVTRALA